MKLTDKLKKAWLRIGISKKEIDDYENYQTEIYLKVQMAKAIKKTNEEKPA